MGNVKEACVKRSIFVTSTIIGVAGCAGGASLPGLGTRDRLSSSRIAPDGVCTIAPGGQAACGGGGGPTPTPRYTSTHAYAGSTAVTNYDGTYTNFAHNVTNANGATTTSANLATSGSSTQFTQTVTSNFVGIGTYTTTWSRPQIVAGQARTVTYSNGAVHTSTISSDGSTCSGTISGNGRSFTYNATFNITSHTMTFNWNSSDGGSGSFVITDPTIAANLSARPEVVAYEQAIGTDAADRGVRVAVIRRCADLEGFGNSCDHMAMVCGIACFFTGPAAELAALGGFGFAVLGYVAHVSASAHFNCTGGTS